MSRLKAKIRNLQQKTSAYGVVVSTMVGRANVKLSTGGKTIHGVRVIGGSVNPGDAVYIEYQGGEPVIQTGSGITYSGQYKFADKLSIGRDTPPAGNCPLVEAGWGIDVATGIISKNNVYIDPAGHIKLGTADDDFAAMSAADTTYRFWAGKLSSSSAPFRVSKAGALWSTSGTLANWTISTDNLSTDSSNVVLSAATNPYIRLGTAAPPSFHGFWVGKDTTYKLYLGDHDGNYIKWETSVLTIKGTINASLGLIGGWTIGDTSLIAGSGGTTVGLDSGGTNPTIYAGSATPSAAPVRIYNDGDFHFGSTTAYLDWNGTVLSIQANLQSSDYVSGVSGWGITLSGDAEFNNLNIRGTIHAAVFEYGVIQATAGTLMVTKSAGTLYTAFQLPAESGLLTFRIKNLKASTSPFVQGDTVRCQYYSGGIYGFWAKITTMDPPEVEYTECHSTTTNWDMGTTPEGTWVPEGTAVVDYGTTGTGYISLSTDGTIGATPNMTMAYIDSSIPAASTMISRIGNLRNSYAYSDTDIYGAAFGKYHSTDESCFITIDTTVINTDEVGGIRIYSRVNGSNTQQMRLYVDGTVPKILVGEVASGKSNVLISAGDISIRNNTTERISMTATGYLYIRDSGGNAVFTFDSSTGAEFTKPLTLATTGGIYQGTGTFASPTTGLKIYNSGGYGKISGYNATSEQWTADTDGVLKAGAGAVKLDALGLHLVCGSGDENTIKFEYGGAVTLKMQQFTSGSDMLSYIDAIYSTSGGSDFHIRSQALSTYIGKLDLYTTSGSSNTYIEIISDSNATNPNLVNISGNTTVACFIGGNLNISKGLYVGGSSGIATEDDIIADGSVYVGGEIGIAGDSCGVGRRYSWNCVPSSAYYYGMDSDPSWTQITSSPFSSVGSVQYTASHMQITMSSTSGSRHFICKTGYTPTYNYIYAQLGLSASGTNTGIGIRIDDGSNDDDNFVEFLLTYTGTAGEYKIRRLYATGGGGVTDNSSTVTLDFAQILLQIYISKTSGWSSWTAEGLISIGMTGMGASRLGLTTGTLTWTPTRVGVTTRKSADANSWYQGYCDFVWTY